MATAANAQDRHGSDSSTDRGRRDTVIVLDVETIGGGRPDQAEAIAEMAEAREMDPEAFAALCPPLAQVVCVGLLDLASGRELAILDGAPFLKPTTRADISVDGSERRVVDGEAALLAPVNAVLAKASRIVTFSGRTFDLPVLIHRSLIHGLSPCPRLVQAAREYRYKPNLHIDLREQFTFFGAGGGGPLRAWCLGYGVADPKANGSGAKVAELVAAGRLEELAAYCMGDVRSTAALYKRWADAVGVA